MPGELLTGAVAVIGILLGLVGWFAQHSYLRVERELKAEREERERGIQAERDARMLELKIERNERTSDLNGFGKSLADYKLEVADKYVRNTELEALERRIINKLDEIREDQREIFKRLDEKQDKVRNRGGD